MTLADDKNWDGEGWGFTSNSVVYVKVYCYYPPYSILPYCQHRDKSYEGARPELYERRWPTRPKKLLTAKEVLRKPRSGCCSACSHIKRAYEEESI